MASVAWDLSVWALLRRPERKRPYWARVVAEALDNALWSLAPYPEGTYDYGVLPSVPLALEAGLLRGWRALVVPCASLAAITTVRRAARRRCQAAPLLWQVLAVAMGVTFRRYDRRVRAEVLRAAARRRAASTVQAELAGQLEVAAGAGSLIDRMQEIAFLIGRPSPGSALESLATAWKAQLSDRSRLHATYLDDALRHWARQHNAHPDLSSRVEFHLAEGEGTLLLTGTQIAALHAILDRLDGLGLRGAVRVVVEPGAPSRPPGGKVKMAIGQWQALIPIDEHRPPRPPDVAVIAFLTSLAWYARTAMAAAESVPILAALPASLGSLAAIPWSERVLRDKGHDAHGEILAVAAGLAGLHTILGTLTMRRRYTANGHQNFVLYASLTAPAVLAGHYLDGLTTVQRASFAAAMAGVAGIGLTLSLPALQVRQFIAGLSWPIAALLPGLHTDNAFKKVAADLDRQLRSTDQIAAADAFNSGRQSVIELVTAAFHDARKQIHDLSDTIEPDRLEIIETRLQEVSQCLEQLRSSSSMTTRSWAPGWSPSSPDTPI